jgi:hypothetical protein
MTQVIGKYSLQGYDIQHAFFGHLHSAYISDYFSRGGSICGSNTYNENALQLVSRASQNLHILFEDGSMDSTKIDIQDSETGYDITDITEAYNTKSANKLKSNDVIIKVVI